MNLTAAGLETLRSWFATLTGLPQASVIWRDQNAPAPARPYIALELMGRQTVGRDVYTEIEIPDGDDWPDGSRSLTGVRTFILSVQACTPGTDAQGGGVSPLGALDLLETIQTALRSDEGQTKLAEAGVVYYQALLQPSSLPVIIGREYEQRAAMDLQMGYGSASLEIIPRMRSADITLESADQTGDTLETDSFTVEAA